MQGEVWSDLETSSDEEEEDEEEEEGDSDAEEASGSGAAASSTAVEEVDDSDAEEAESDSAASSQTNASEVRRRRPRRLCSHRCVWPLFYVCRMKALHEFVVTSLTSGWCGAHQGHATGGSGRGRHGTAGASGRGGSRIAASAKGRRGGGGGGKQGGGGGRGGGCRRPVVDAAGNVDMDAVNALMPGKMGRPFKSAENAARAGIRLLQAANAELQVRPTCS